MAKSNRTANEAQLKARRTSLGKKTVDELITIILRKDKTERSMNSKIQELTSLLKEANELNEENATRIVGFKKDMAGMEEILKTKKEQIDNLLSERSNLEDKCNNYCKEVVRLKYLCNFRRKAIFTCFGIIITLIILICVL